MPVDNRWCVRAHPASPTLASLAAVALTALARPASAQVVLQGVWRDTTIRRADVLCYHPARARVVLFPAPDSARAGANVVTPIEWDGAFWQPRHVWSGFGQRSRSAAALAPSGNVLLFGGLAISSTLLNDTSEWDGFGWRGVTPLLRPSARVDHAMAFDVRRRCTVLFGGSTGQALLADTWEWDGSQWSQATPPTTPPTDGRPRLAYDARRGVTVLLEVTPGLPLVAWEWDGVNWRRNAVPGAPLGSAGWAITYAASLGLCVVVAGTLETWHFDGAAWQSRGGATAPGAGGYAMTFDPRRGVAILDTGHGLAEWDGNVWQRLAPSAPASDAAMAFDSRRGQLLAFDNRSGSVGWRWDGTSWRIIDGVVRPVLTSSSLAYVANRDRMVLFGQNAVAETWEWDGAVWDRKWRGIGPAVGPMAYDRVRDRVVLLSVDGLTWEWDGNSWLQRNSAASPPVGWHRLVFDAARQRTICLTAQMDLWAWDGQQWSALNPQYRPPARGGMALTYDDRRQLVIGFGGAMTVGSTYWSVISRNDLWAWDGTAWLSVAAPAGPSPRHGARLIYDSLRDQFVLHGGIEDFSSWQGANASVRFDTWVLGPVQLATAQRHGRGCGGGPEVARQQADGRPTLGNAGFAVVASSLAASAQGLWLLGRQPQSRELTAGCVAWVGDPMAFGSFVTDAGGTARIALPIPARAELAGARVFLQSGIADPLQLTDAMQLDLGY